MLRGQADGSYKLSHRTQAWSFNQRDEIEFGIKNRVILFSLHCAYDCLLESWSSQYKFKLINDQLILIGEDHGRSLQHGDQGNDENGSSVNYLTQKVIYWEKPVEGAYSEKKFTFKLNAPLRFSEFNLETMENAPLKLLGTPLPEK